MNHRMAFALVGLAGALCLGAGAASADPEYDSCIENSRESEFARCGVEWVEREDRRLNAVWREIQPMIEGRERAALVAEQRNWVRFNQDSCEYWYSEYWGTIGRNTWYPRCRADIIVARTAQLREIRDNIASQGE